MHLHCFLSRLTRLVYEAHPGSDVDILVEFNRPVGLFGLIELQNRLEEILDCKVDLGTPDNLKARIRQSFIQFFSGSAGKTEILTHQLLR